MYFIKFAGLLNGKLDHLHRYDLKAALNNVIQNGAGMSFGKRIRLNHGKGLCAHNFLCCFWAAKIREY